VLRTCSASAEAMGKTRNPAKVFSFAALIAPFPEE
jgi:hypothetical protein